MADVLTDADMESTATPDVLTDVDMETGAAGLEAKLEPGKGVTWEERMVLKELIDKSPTLQETYLRKRGYDVRHVRDDLQVRKANEDWAPVDPAFDPRKIDPIEVLKDVGDVIGDVLQVGAATAGGAVGGLLGGIPGSIAGAGLAAGAVEAMKQEKAVDVGARDSVSLPEVGMAGAVEGALTGGFGLVGRGARTVVKAAAPMWGTTGSIARGINRLFPEVPISSVSDLEKAVKKAAQGTEARAAKVKAAKQIQKAVSLEEAVKVAKAAPGESKIAAIARQEANEAKAAANVKAARALAARATYKSTTLKEALSQTKEALAKKPGKAGGVAAGIGQSIIEILDSYRRPQDGSGTSPSP